MSTEKHGKRKAVIIGAGPAGLTAAYELLQRTDIVPIVLEKSQEIGGISRTVNYKGNRIDIGGHRFFSKSDRVMSWWLEILPMEATNGQSLEISYQARKRTVSNSGHGPDPLKEDRVMLIRSRKSRIYFLRHFFDYPIRLNKTTITQLGLVRMARIGLSYLWRVAFPIRNEKNLEQFFTNRFGGELYRTFFKDYTEKVWGVACREISAEWGAQRVKGLSLTKTLVHAASQLLRKERDVAQKTVETSLIERFLYPKYGPGQMWEEVAAKIRERGGTIVKGVDVTGVQIRDDKVLAVQGSRGNGHPPETFAGDVFLSTMPIKDLVRAFDVPVAPEIKAISEGLVYRDFITVGLLLEEMKVREEHADGGKLIKDNWVYVQEPDVRLGRMQVFNNWSPHMVANPSTVWLGLEYFCNEGDDLWTRSEKEMIELAVEELTRIGIIEASAVLDATVIKVPKTYPAYFGTYSRFDQLRTYLDSFENLFLIGRNGMHKYNNQDHSMLTAMVAVDNILAGVTDKATLWAVNTEQDYHESK